MAKNPPRRAAAAKTPRAPRKGASTVIPPKPTAAERLAIDIEALGAMLDPQSDAGKQLRKINRGIRNIALGGIDPTTGPSSPTIIRQGDSDDMPGQVARDGLGNITLEGFQAIARLTKDMRESARLMGDEQARFLVDAYYQMQNDRIRSDHQVRQLRKSDEPSEMLEWYADQFGTIERQISLALDRYSLSRDEGKWARSITGIGGIIVAGLLANAGADPERTTVGKLWSFAGLNPDRKWEKGQKRPWNATLKRLCYLIGDSFTKFQNHEAEDYGKYFKARRAFEIRGNDDGRFADQARQALIEKKFGKDTEAIAWYGGCYPAGTCRVWNDLEIQARAVFPDDSARRQKWLTTARFDYLQAQRLEAGKGLPMLPPARILLRAQRWPTKLFLSHWHHVTWEINFHTPPRVPYILDKKAVGPFPDLEPLLANMHGNMIMPPNWPMTRGLPDRTGEVPPE